MLPQATKPIIIIKISNVMSHESNPLLYARLSNTPTTRPIRGSLTAIKRTLIKNWHCQLRVFLTFHHTLRLPLMRNFILYNLESVNLENNLITIFLYAKPGRENLKFKLTKILEYA